MKDIKNIERVRKWQQEQKSKGLCIECSNPASGLRCDACNKRRAENRKKNYQEWKENGLCCQCGKETLNDKNYCEKHYLMKISHTRLGSSKYWKELNQLIEKQNYKCAYTGLVLTPAVDASVDHIIALSTDAEQYNKIENLQWVHSAINRMKNNHTEEDFLKYIKLIYENRLSG